MKQKAKLLCEYCLNFPTLVDIDTLANKLILKFIKSDDKFIEAQKTSQAWCVTVSGVGIIRENNPISPLHHLSHQSQSPVCDGSAK